MMSHTFICVNIKVPHSYVWRATSICVTWLIHMCNMPHSYVWRDSFRCVTYLIHMGIKVLTRGGLRFFFDYVPWLIRTHPRVWLASFIWDVTHSYGTWLIRKERDPYLCVTWLIRKGRDPFMCVTWLIRKGRDPFMWDVTHSQGLWPIYVCDVTHS